MGITTRLVYVEFAGEEETEESFAWYEGKVLTADQRGDRAQLHRELLEIVKRAANITLDELRDKYPPEDRDEYDRAYAAATLAG